MLYTAQDGAVGVIRHYKGKLCHTYQVQMTAYYHAVASRVTNTTPSTTRIQNCFCFCLTRSLLRIAKFAMNYSAL